MPATPQENRLGQMLFSCCNSPKSRLTTNRLADEFGLNNVSHAVDCGWITRAHAGERAHLITMEGRKILRFINNAAVSQVLTLQHQLEGMTLADVTG
jgi:hypothetical protein